MKNPINNFAFVASIAVSVVSFAASAHAMNAYSSDALPTKRVSYADLNTDSETGARALYTRLRVASREVCVGFEATDSLVQRSARSKCYATALSGAVAQVHSAALTELYSRSQIR
jgi:UrcA family protein